MLTIFTVFQKKTVEIEFNLWSQVSLQSVVDWLLWRIVGWSEVWRYDGSSLNPWTLSTCASTERNVIRKFDVDINHLVINTACKLWTQTITSNWTVFMVPLTPGVGLGVNRENINNIVVPESWPTVNQDNIRECFSVVVSRLLWSQVCSEWVRSDWSLDGME